MAERTQKEAWTEMMEISLQAGIRLEFQMKCRVLRRQGSSLDEVSMARIEGAETKDTLRRRSISYCCYSNSRYADYTYSLGEGIYEYTVTRRDDQGDVIFREQKWIIVCGENLWVYDGDEMDYQSVLCCLQLLQCGRDETALPG